VRLALRRGVALLLGIFLPLAILEIALQISSSSYRAALLASRESGIDRGAARILCVGDSNTFGVRVAAADSYPGRLQAMLDEVAGVGKWQVLNDGVPGSNTAQLAARVRRRAEEVAPQIVIALGGINNTWNAARGEEPQSLLDRSRLVRLAKIVWNDLHAAPREPGNAGVELAEVERVGGGERRDDDALVALTADDLRRLIAAAREAGAVPVLMTYPGQHPHAAPMNRAAREVAAAEGCLLVDHDRAFQGYVERFGYDAILFADSHPAEAGYTLLARDLLAALIDASLVAAAMPAHRFEPTRFNVAAALTVEHDGKGRPVALLLVAEPDAAFQVYVSPLREPQIDLGTRKIPVGAHPWVEESKQRPELRGTLDAAGRAKVLLPDVIADLPAGQRLFAAFVTQDPRVIHQASVRSISGAVEIARRD
jgi:lysophospholipase L1-like esterase